MNIPKAVPSSRIIFTLLLALAAGLLLLSSSTATAAPPVAKDGKIHACYKAKGKGKGTLRVVGKRQARCPKQWRKVSWYATPVPGPAGAPGERGAPGPGADVTIKSLEDEVAGLLVRVESLEGILEGVTNQQLLGAIGLTPVVEALCTQAGILTNRTNLLEVSLGGISLNGVLTTLGGLLNIPTLPGALPAFNCPSS